jgi:hypothetical protein
MQAGYATAYQATFYTTVYYPYLQIRWNPRSWNPGGDGSSLDNAINTGYSSVPVLSAIRISQIGAPRLHAAMCMPSSARRLRTVLQPHAVPGACSSTQTHMPRLGTGSSVARSCTSTKRLARAAIHHADGRARPAYRKQCCTQCLAHAAHTQTHTPRLCTGYSPPPPALPPGDVIRVQCTIDDIYIDGQVWSGFRYYGNTPGGCACHALACGYQVDATPAQEPARCGAAFASLATCLAGVPVRHVC